MKLSNARFAGSEELRHSVSRFYACEALAAKGVGFVDRPSDMPGWGCAGRSFESPGRESDRTFHLFWNNPMTRIRINGVYEAPAPDDGCRVLVDRLWPRAYAETPCIATSGPGTLRLRPDCAAGITPTPGTAGRSSAAGTPTSCVRRRPCGSFVRGIEGADTVTLLYASKKAAENHALILQEYLQRELPEGLQTA